MAQGAMAGRGYSCYARPPSITVRVPPRRNRWSRRSRGPRSERRCCWPAWPWLSRRAIAKAGRRPRRKRNLHPRRRRHQRQRQRRQRQHQRQRQQQMNRVTSCRPPQLETQLPPAVRDARAEAVHRRPRRDGQAAARADRRDVQPHVLLRRQGRAARHRVRVRAAHRGAAEQALQDRHRQQDPRGLRAAAARASCCRRSSTARSTWWRRRSR